MSCLECGGAVGVLFGAGDAGVGGVDVVGGAEHRDFGQQSGAAWSSKGRAQAGAVPGSRRGRGRGSGRPVRVTRSGARVR